MKTENKYLWLYLTGFFWISVLPLLNLPPWFSPPDWGKTIVFRIIVAIMLSIFIWQIFSEKKLVLKTSPAFWLLFALLGIFLLAAIFSSDRTFSFWGTPYRSGGFINFASYIIFAVLAFLILRKSDWGKFWNLSLIIAVLVCVIAVFQEFGVLSNVFVSVGEPWSTIGGSTFLAAYLLILTFLAISFTIKSIKNLDRKWFFYLPALLLFIFVILITGSRAAYLGLIIGFFYFVFLYPEKKCRLKIGAGIFFICLFLIICYLNTNLPIPELLKKNKIFQELEPRFSISLFLNDPRFSVWKISMQGLAEKPVLGYGPENFSIAFDKHYDPSLSRMMTIEQSTPIYYDRAHNFLFDIGVTAGIPALIIYISLFAVIFRGLQKIKKKQPEYVVICQGIQASFIAYLTANFFGFDVFSTYLISFLLIAFSLSLINQENPEKTIIFKKNLKPIIIVPLSIALIWFIWAYNIKPFQINIEINRAIYSARAGDYERSLRRIDDAAQSNTFLNDYLRANYVNIINGYIQKDPKAIALIPKAIEIIKQSLEQKPTFTRYWILLGTYYNILLENYQKSYPEFIETWTNEANKAFEKAVQLSPKRQEIYIGWASTYLVTGDYEKAKEKAQKCLDLNQELGDCWWLTALININENEIDKAKENIKISEQKNYEIDSEISLLQLRKAYLNIENYQKSCEIYYRLTEININNVQYYLDALACYLNNKEFEQAKKTATHIIKSRPKYGESINEALKQAGLEPIL